MTRPALGLALAPPTPLRECPACGAPTATAGVPCATCASAEERADHDAHERGACDPATCRWHAPTPVRVVDDGDEEPRW